MSIIDLSIQNNLKMGATFYAKSVNIFTGSESLGVAKNIILDIAYIKMASGSRPIDAQYIKIGTGTSTPVPTQTNLDNPVFTKLGTVVIDEENPRKWYLTATFESNEANGPGNTSNFITEVCAGWWPDIQPINRALFKDNLGNPIAIEKSPAQILHVTMEFEIQRMA